MSKRIAFIAGIVFLAVGLLGMFPNPIVSSSTDALFHTDGFHNIVHLITGAALVYASTRGERTSASAMRIFGFVYLAVAALGFLAIGTSGETDILGMAINGADNVLHLILSAGLLAAGYAVAPRSRVREAMA